jgi:hypothetical protein
VFVGDTFIYGMIGVSTLLNVDLLGEAIKVEGQPAPKINKSNKVSYRDGKVLYALYTLNRKI